MVLTPSTTQKITSYVKHEPRTIQEIAKHIGKSWVTADSYVEKIIRDTGLLRVKVFRPNTQGALKIVFWNYAQVTDVDDVRQRLYERIRTTVRKQDFDPLDIYQHVPSKKKRASKENMTAKQHTGLSTFLHQASQDILCFSGNLSWTQAKEGAQPFVKIIERLLVKGIHVKVLCRIDLATIENINALSVLLTKYPDQLDIRHMAQPLRGFIIDQKAVRLRDEKKAQNYKSTELREDIRIAYEWDDEQWTQWMAQVFWNLYRAAVPLQQRMEELKKIF